MAGYIPRIFIKNLLARTDIVKLINTRLKLKPQHKNFYACCPFHYEKIPSFVVNSEKQFYHCFGCGAHGNAIDFLINYDRLEFIETIEELAASQGIEIPYIKKLNVDNKKELNSRKNLYQLMNKLNNFYQQVLKEQTAVKACYYLQQQRGLSKKIITKFSIGFAPSGWNNILQRFGSSKEDQSLLKKSGMIIVNNNNKSYDRFRERIIFPIRDTQNRIIGFGGRLLDDSHPKYINSPETEIFHKGRHLYGIYEAKQQHLELSQLLVVEGYMDVITLAQFNIDYAVALLGTSITTEHIQLLYRTTDLVICCYDGDLAGRKAAWRTLEKTIPYLNDGRQLRFMFLKEGEDPDQLIRKIGKEAFEQQIKQAYPMSTFLFETLMQKVDLSSPDGKAKLSQLALPLIEKIPGFTLRIYLRQQLGIKIGILDDNQFNKLLLHTSQKLNRLSTNQGIKKTPIRNLISLLIQYPRLSNVVPIVHGLENIIYPGVPLFIELVKICILYPKINTGQLLEFYRDSKYYHYIKTLANCNYLINDQMIESMFIDILKNFYDSILEKRQEKLIAIARYQGLTDKERLELWSLNQALAKRN
ncbi:DNA primase [Candidatus Mikella endobia]|uniref:DNA primase n=1 Tax=Candidatus Mikella endobia TaxID=1778264 RepID=A0A143WQ10_9ENTR|nr:DNA primase [Candidatus Mikella endobia]CUX95818.1 DNA primase [Candidatus Mikella endobia]